MARRLRLARGRHVAVLDAAGRHPHADRPPIAPLAGAASLGRRSRYRGDLHARGTHPLHRAGDVEGGSTVQMCCDSLLASFKVWNAATVGGNICMSLPAGSMISLTASLEATYTLWPRDGEPREVAAVDFVTGNHANVLGPASCFAQSISLRGRFPSALLSAELRSRTWDARRLSSSERRALAPTISCSPSRRRRVRPFQLRFDRVPDARTLREAIFATIPEADYFDDVHGSAALQAPPHLLLCRADPRRAPARSGDMKFSINGKSISAEPAPASVCAPFCASRDVSASRRAATRATAEPALSGSTARHSIVA